MARRLLCIGAIMSAVVVLAGCNFFGDGVFPVGSVNSQGVLGVATPGTYEATGGQECFWERTSDLSGSILSVLAIGLVSGPDVVTILPSDGGFQSQGCGVWTPLPTTGPEVTTFGDGGHAVGIDIAPGTYTAPGGQFCFWEQDSDFLGTDSSIISGDVPVGPVTVTLAPNAVKFLVGGCGTWTHVGPSPVGASTCTATMSNPTPGDSGPETVNVTSNVPNAPVMVTKHYQTTTSSDFGSTDGMGSASITFDIGQPTIGFTVEVDVSINNGQATCSTSFTPQ